MACTATGWAKQTVKSHPTLLNVAYRTSRRAHRVAGEIERIANQSNHAALIDPFRLIDVCPSDIDYRLDSGFGTKYSLLSRYSPVVGGGWDRERQSLSEYDLFYSIRKYFEEGVVWAETDWYARVQRQMENGELRYKWGCQTIDEFEERCARLNDLYEHIKSNGYKRQRELRTSDGDPIDGGKTRKTAYRYPPELHEISVHIGRDGQFSLHEGRNRFSIVRSLDLESIPVRVMVRHQDWQAKRAEIAATESMTDLASELREYCDHPDTQDIRPDQ